MPFGEPKLDDADDITSATHLIEEILARVATRERRTIHEASVADLTEAVKACLRIRQFNAARRARDADAYQKRIGRG